MKPHVVLGLLIGAVVGVILGGVAAHLGRSEDFGADALQRSVEARFEEKRWRAVELSPGVYSVALCTDAGVCAQRGSGTTGYRFTNPDQAKYQADRLEAFRTQPDLFPVLVP